MTEQDLITFPHLAQQKNALTVGKIKKINKKRTQDKKVEKHLHP